MAYQFQNQYTAKAKISDETSTESTERESDHISSFTLTGINGVTTDADAVMGGLSILLDIVGWTVADAQRIVTQDIDEVTP